MSSNVDFYRIEDLLTDEERLVNYARNNQIISLDPNQNTVVERLAGLNRQLLEAENERKTAEAAFNAASAPGAAEALAENDAKQVSDLEAKLNELRQKRANSWLRPRRLKNVETSLAVGPDPRLARKNRSAAEKTRSIARISGATTSALSRSHASRNAVAYDRLRHDVARHCQTKWSVSHLA